MRFILLFLVAKEPVIRLCRQKFVKISATDFRKWVLRVRDLSGSVARHLSGCHIAPKGVGDDTDASATGDTQDEVRGSL